MIERAGVRRLDNWIDSYLTFTEILPSPLLLRRWAAIAFVAAAMERKVWVRTMGSDLYPNLYTILIGPPGIGKGVALHPGEELLRQVPDIHVGPSDMTASALVDALNESVRRIVFAGDPPYVEFNSLTVISRELGVLIPGWDGALLNNLTDIYDGRPLDQKRRGRDLRIKIAHPQINLIGATTPSYLNELMPAGAWDQGFISRTLLIHSGDRVARDPFEEEISTHLNRLQDDLLHDLKEIGRVYGKLGFAADAATAIKEWVKAGYPPEPTHSRLQHYNSRRLAHLLKLCMVSSLSRSSSKIIQLDNYAEALNWLVEAEHNMLDIFKSISMGGDNAVMEETWNFVWTLYAKEKKPIAEHRIIHFIKERAPSHSVMKILEVMIKSGMFQTEYSDKGFVGFKPAAKATRLEKR